MENARARPLAILAALREELSPIERLLEGRHRVRAEGGVYTAGSIAGRPVVLARTGVGARAARRVADWLIRTAAPRAIIGVGFAAGLKEGLDCGHLVLGEVVYEPPAPEGEGPREWQSDPDLLLVARSAAGEGPEVQVGRIATTRTVLSTAEMKRAFGERHQALVADMESSGVARAGNVHDAPAVYLRAVVDPVDFDLPLDFGALLTPEGGLRPLRTLAAVLRRPAALRGLADLRRRSLRAAETLARALARLLAALP